MVVVVTSNVAARFRGFLASAMLEIAPGVYTAPRMSKGVRDRVWQVLEDWHGQLGGGAIVMTFRDASEPCGQGIRTLGLPARNFFELDGGVITTVTRTT
ncbi:MAG: type I-E CRISPR-associated endoribonuclease Cas2e [Alphaproteobacteria bacterium]